MTTASDDPTSNPTPDQGEAVVRVVELTKHYIGPPEVIALQPCSFTVNAGDYVAITGPSGSGKSTLLSLLGLLDEPSSGEYWLDGDNVAELNDRQRSSIRAHKLGFVFQAFHLIGYRSVVDNVQLGLTYQGVSRRLRRRLALDVIEQVGLTHRTNALCSTLSGGERQRVAIARVLIREPSLVLCDEPTGNLDTSTSSQVLDLIEQLHRDGLTIVVITHDPDTASRAERNLIIADGYVTETRVIA